MSTGEMRTCLQSTLLLQCGVSLRERGAEWIFTYQIKFCKCR